MPRGTRWSACTAQRENGSFCDARTVPDAPFPICERHLMQAYQFMTELVRGSLEARAFDARREIAETVSPVTKQHQVVYYVLVHDQIKIGTTGQGVNLRLADLPPSRQILAIEPGSKTLEGRRHDQFSHLRIARNREWFRPAPDLWRHIGALRERYGDPSENVGAAS